MSQSRRVSRGRRVESRSATFADYGTFVTLSVAVLFGAAASGAEPQSQTIVVVGVSREYLVFAPQGAPGPRPLVVLLHGHGGSARQVIGANGRPSPFHRWLKLAERDGIVLVVPEGIAGSDHLQGWNDCRGDNVTNTTSNDVGVIRAILDEVERTLPIDRRRVFAAGMSNGAFMALRLAIEAPDRFSAVAIVAGAAAAKSECPEPTHPMPVLFMHGTADPLVPFSGGTMTNPGRGTVLSTDASVRVWTELDHAAGDPITTALPDTDRHDGSHVTRLEYRNRAGDPVVLLYRVEGGGHAEPSPTERYGPLYTAIAGRQNGDIEAADEIWTFFRRVAGP